MKRRLLLTRTVALACAPAARLAWAAVGGSPSNGILGPDNRLVVVLLRGALDGLAAVPAPGDPAWGDLRGQTEAQPAPLPLDGFFALHPRLTTLHQWWQAGQLLVVHAVAQGYRERSHFDAQQLLESGGRVPFELSSGWLGRALQALPPTASRQAPGLALLPHLPLALRGASGAAATSDRVASNWAPSRLAEAADPSANDDFFERAQRLYAADAEFDPLWRQAMAQGGLRMAGSMDGGAPRQGNFATLSREAGRFLVQPDGPRLAWLELDGWDTHTLQAQRLDRLLPVLDGGLTALRESLGDRWATTSVLVMTEFGRSAVPNGTGGTDHGTAGVAFLAGGAVRGGRVLADWPGLSSNALWQGRDLRPTTDLRALQRAVLAAHWGLEGSVITDTVLPGAPPALSGLYRNGGLA